MVFIPVFAQQPDTQKLKPIEIKENRIHLPFSKVNRNIGVITSKEIAKIPVFSVAEALSFQSGVDIRSRGVMGTQADVSIRGGSFEQTQVLINGFKLNDPQTGHHMLNLPLPLGAITQMEVLKGPGAVKYGQNAFSGAINLVVEPKNNTSFSVGGMYGEHNTYQLTAAVNWAKKNYKQMLTVANQASDGYRKNADFSNQQLFYIGSLAANKSVLDIMAGGTWRKFGAGGFYVPDSEEYEEVNTYFTGIKYTYKTKKIMVRPQVYYRNNQDDYVFMRSNPTLFQNQHISHVVGAEFHSTYTSKLGITGFGAEWRSEALKSTNLGVRNRNISGLFVEHRAYYKKLSVTPGLYVNAYSDFGSFAFPAIDAGMEITNQISLYSSVGKSFRVPSYTDLYYQGPNNIGNPNLQPEQAVTAEGGVKYQNKKVYIQAGVFQRNASKLIDWVRENQISPWQPQNFYEVSISGFESEFKANDFKVFGLNPVRASVSYTYLNADLLNTTNLQTRYSLSNLRHQLVAVLVYPIIKNFYHSVSFRYLERVSLPNYNLIDTRLFWQEKSTQIFIDITNIANTAYTEAGFVPMPGRWVKLGFNFSFSPQPK